jgi:hypothetical protein
LDIYSLFNYSLPVSGEPAPGGLRPTSNRTPAAAAARGSTFITPQSLAAYPLASGFTAAAWQAAQLLLGDMGKSFWTCFVIGMAIALVNFYVSITDPKLNVTDRDKRIGVIFALINGLYLFITAVGIKVSFAPR